MDLPSAFSEPPGVSCDLSGTSGDLPGALRDLSGMSISCKSISSDLSDSHLVTLGTKEVYLSLLASERSIGAPIGAVVASVKSFEAPKRALWEFERSLRGFERSLGVSKR